MLRRKLALAGLVIGLTMFEWLARIQLGLEDHGVVVVSRIDGVFDSIRESHPRVERS